jgi:hypothetical protein
MRKRLSLLMAKKFGILAHLAIFKDTQLIYVEEQSTNSHSHLLLM